jgi:hypothetical protein
MALLDAAITCPQCGHTVTELMPRDRCVFFWECAACHAVSRPKPGDCCVYCSYADRRCPPVQDGQPCPDVE